MLTFYKTLYQHRRTWKYKYPNHEIVFLSRDNGDVLTVTGISPPFPSQVSRLSLHFSFFFFSNWSALLFPTLFTLKKRTQSRVCWDIYVYANAKLSVHSSSSKSKPFCVRSFSLPLLTQVVCYFWVYINIYAVHFKVFLFS